MQTHFSFRKYHKSADLVIFFLIWRVALLFLGFLSQKIIPDNSYAIAHLSQKVHPWLNVWVKWDSVWFYEVIKVGYVREGLTAYFPLYPLIVRFVSKILPFMDPILVGLSLSSLFTLAAFLVFYKLLRLDYENDLARRAVFYFLIFPSALFYTLIYSESLFLLLSVSAFYFARRRRWFLAGLCGFLTALTRVVGILLFVPLAIEYLSHGNKDRMLKLKAMTSSPAPSRQTRLARLTVPSGAGSSVFSCLLYLRSWKGGVFAGSKIKSDVLFLLLTPIGLLTYMFCLGKTFNDPLLFLHVAKDWGRFSGNFMVSFTQSLNLPKLGFFIFFLIGSFFLYEWVRKSYGVYVFLSALAPMISGTTMSMNRYFAVLFPVYILLARLGRSRLLDWTFTTVFLLFQAYSTILYVNGYWVG